MTLPTTLPATRPPVADRTAAIVQAWAGDVAAWKRFDRTLQLADAIAAGKYWKRFLDLFTEEAA
jgi:hypothetical protein